MDGIYPQRLQVFDGPRLCKGEKLSRIFGIIASDGEVAMVHLVDDKISW